MKKDLLEKLKNYSKTAAALAIVGGTANAQIIYTDVDADVTLNTFPSNHEIDFDGDGNFEININLFTNDYTSYQSAKIKASPNTTATSVVTSNNFVAVLNSGDNISSTNDFANEAYKTGLILNTYYSSNTNYFFNWNNPGQTEKFIGVKFDISGATHYGWIRASTTSNSWNDISVTIHDFAYQSIADSSIIAGDDGTTTLINKVNDLTTNIYPNPVSNVLNIELQETDNYTVKLTNLLGKEIFVKEINGNSTKIDISDLEKAVYVLTISNNKIITTKKIVIK